METNKHQLFPIQEGINVSAEAAAASVFLPALNNIFEFLGALALVSCGFVLCALKNASSKFDEWLDFLCNLFYLMALEGGRIFS